MQRSIFLVGPMGAGKSTIGAELARHLDFAFHDSDATIEERSGVPVSLIFEIEGEAGFRRREAAIIDELTQLPDIVLATGGGAVLDPENRKYLTGRGTVIYLHASVKQLLRRTANDRNRPLLQTDDPERKLTELMAEREPLYREVADLIVNTGNRTVGRIAKSIATQISQQ